MGRVKNYLLSGAVIIMIIAASCTPYKHVQAGASRAIDTVNTGTGPNTGTGATLLQFAQTFNDLANLIDTLQIDTLNADNVSALIGVNGNQAMSTEDLGTAVLFAPSDTTVTAALGKIVYKSSDNHIYVCRSLTGKKWYQMDN